MENYGITKELEAYNMVVSVRDSSDRDMQIWWREYTEKITSYRAIRNESLCTSPEALERALEKLTDNIKRVN